MARCWAHSDPFRERNMKFLAAVLFACVATLALLHSVYGTPVPPPNPANPDASPVANPADNPVASTAAPVANPAAVLGAPVASPQEVAADPKAAVAQSDDDSPVLNDDNAGAPLAVANDELPAPAPLAEYEDPSFVSLSADAAPNPDILALPQAPLQPLTGLDELVPDAPAAPILA